MDKTALKKFSIMARNALIRSVADKCGLIGIREDGIQNPLPNSTKDIQFFDAGTGAPSSISGSEIEKRNALVRAIREKVRDSDYKTAYQYIVEQVAYTWFNRLIAIRFMEVNEYLPSRIRVLSSEQEGKLEPDILSMPFDADFDFTEQERDTIIQLKDRGQKEDIYHNQIDARGDKQLTENEVYVACAEAIEELYTLLIRLAKNKVVSHFLITADHGFIYKRDKLEESDKISIGSADNQFSGRRYAVAEQAVDADGVTSYSLATILGNSDNRVVTVPIGADVFKAGGGSCYVHGGSSLQEMLVPVIEMSTKTGQQKKVFQKARISLVSILNKITNLITTLEFIQSEPVGDGVNEARYRIFFVDAEDNKISSENVLVADKKDADAQKRITRLKFRFKDMQYNPNAKYYLVAYDEENEYTTVMKQEVRIDMAFASDFGF